MINYSNTDFKVSPLILDQYSYLTHCPYFIQFIHISTIYVVAPANVNFKFADRWRYFMLTCCGCAVKEKNMAAHGLRSLFVLTVFLGFSNCGKVSDLRLCGDPACEG